MLTDRQDNAAPAAQSGRPAQGVLPAPSGHGKVEHMPKLDMEMGSKMLVRLGWGSRGSPEEIPAELIGCLYYEYVVLRLSPNPGLLAKLLPGTHARARFLHEGASSEFSGTVISHIRRPSLLVFLTYPETLITQSVRKFKRLNSALPSTLYTTEGSVLGTIGDLSMGGCQMIVDIRGQSTARTLESGSGGALQLCLTPDGNPLKVNCIIRNVETERFHLTAGLSFDPNDKKFSKELENYLEMLRSNAR